jgi:hypothetical protein
MTARPTIGPPPTPETLLRNHISAMRKYASDLERALGSESPIVRRIRLCASSNEMALDRITKPKCQACGQETVHG